VTSAQRRIVATDERRRFRREAERHIGNARIIGTADVLVAAIRAGLVTIEEAGAGRLVLEERRFRIPFDSFREVVSGAN
jgi:hypothetical protein